MSKLGKKDTPRKLRRVTALDVARAAGVTRTSVSRAFTSSTYLNKEKRDKILSVAQELGYRPNALAAGLHRSGRSHLVAIVTGDLVNHYDSEILGKLMHELRKIGKWPVVLGGAGDITDNDVIGVLDYPLDALILRGGSVSGTVAEDCAKLGIPLIVSGRAMDSKFVDSVRCDNAKGARLAVETLMSRGRRNLGYIGGQKFLFSDQERSAGFLAALEHYGLDPVVMVESDFSFQGGYDAAIRALCEFPQLDGIFCANDAMALGVLSAVRRELGLSVPFQLSVVGFDDIAMASWPGFDLTTIRNDMDNTVAEIIRLLKRRLAMPDADGQTLVVEPKLIERGTH